MPLFRKPDIEKLKAKRDIKGLIKALRDDRVGESAAFAIREVGDRRVVEPLIKMLGDRKIHVRNRVALALLGLADERAVWPLIRMLKEHGRESLVTPPSDEIVSGFVRIGEPAVEPLIKVIEDYDSIYPFGRGGRLNMQKIAAKALGKIGAPRGVEPIIKVLELFLSWGDEVGVEALKEVNDRRAVDPLINALQHRNRHVREAVAVALGRIGDSRAVEPLMEALKDEYRDVRLKAREALRRIGIEIPYTKIFPLIVCAQCKKQFYYDPRKPLRCPDHPQAELEVAEYPELPRVDELTGMFTGVMFFDGCDVVGISLSSGPSEMRGLGYSSPETYCKLSYDEINGCWMWVEKLPRKRKIGLTIKIVKEAARKFNAPLAQMPVNRLIKGSYRDESIRYRPGNPIGLYNPIDRSFRACPFYVLDRVKASFFPDGKIGLKFTDFLLHYWASTWRISTEE